MPKPLWNFQRDVHSCAQLIELVNEIGFLPLLDSGIPGFSAEAIVAPDCRYVTFPDGGWDWPLWKWKGPAISDGQCVYGKFFNGKAGFVSLEWWPLLCQHKRSKHPAPAVESIEGAILDTLRLQGSLITRELRTACGFGGTKMRSRFDAYVTRLQMAGRIVVEDFIYPRDRHGNDYGWGWALLTTPEQLYGIDKCRSPLSDEEARQRIFSHLGKLLPQANARQIEKLVG